MTCTLPEEDRMLWYEHLDVPLTMHDAASLESKLGLNVQGLSDPDEWVLGHRFVGAAGLEAATVLYLTRRLRGSGVRFDLRTVAVTPPDTAELHAQVKQYIREFTPASEARRQRTGAGSGNQRTEVYAPNFAVVDYYRAQQAALSPQDVTLARAHIAPRIDLEVPALTAAGLGGNVHVDLSFPADRPPVITVALGLSGPMDRRQLRKIRVRAAIGDREVSQRFNSHGIATFESLDADPGTDLLHLTFELK